MSEEPTAALQAVRASSADLLRTVDGRGLTDADMRAPSLCGGWTRGHVLTHLARNADGITTTLSAALRGEVVPRYAGGNEQRDREIADGADRPLAELRADLTDAVERLNRVTGATTDADGWDGTTSGGKPARHWLDRRLLEVEIHHVDLDLGYGPRRWPPYLVAALLPQLVETLPDRSDTALRLVAAGDNVVPALDGHEWTVGSGDPVEVRGPDWALTAWATGRGALVADALSATPALEPW